VITTTAPAEFGRSGSRNDGITSFSLIQLASDARREIAHFNTRTGAIRGFTNQSGGR
jgi:hypothetical protein